MDQVEKEKPCTSPTDLRIPYIRKQNQPQNYLSTSRPFYLLSLIVTAILPETTKPIFRSHYTTRKEPPSSHVFVNITVTNLFYQKSTDYRIDFETQTSPADYDWSNLLSLLVSQTQQQPNFVPLKLHQEPVHLKCSTISPTPHQSLVKEATRHFV